MHTIHTTPGFIISSRNSGEAGKMLSIFTKDLGLIRAVAQGIRFEKSKLRTFTQDYSVGVFSFVKGKEYWRLTNAEEGRERLEKQRLEIVDPVGESADSCLAESADSDFRLGNIESDTHENNLELKKELIAKIALLLGRLLQGEDPHPELFVTLESFFDFLRRCDLSDLDTLESLVVIRILHRLGYVAVIPDLALEIYSDDFDLNRLNKIGSMRVLMNKHINRALRESHL